MAFSHDPFERLTFCGVYSRSFALLLERLDLFMVVALIMYIPFLLIQFSFPTTATTPWGPADATTTTTNTDDDNDLMNNTDDTLRNNPFVAKDQDGNPTGILMGSLLTLYGELFFSAVCGVLGQAAIVLAAAQLYIHGHPSTFSCLQTAWGKFCTLFCGQFCITMAKILAMMACGLISFLLFMANSLLLNVLAIVVALGGFIAYFYISIAMTLYIPAVMIEGHDAMGALRRSLELVSQDFCLIFCTSFCFGFIMFFVNLILGIFTMDGMFGTALAKATFLFQFPLTTLILVVVYFHVRVTREGLNRDVLARELNHHGRAHDYDHVLAMEVVEAEAIAVAEKI